MRLSWTPEQIRRIEQMRQAGHTGNQIAAALGLAREQVRSAFRRRKPPQDVTEPEPASADERIERERERARRKQEIEELRRLLDRATVIRDLREALREAALAAEPPRLAWAPPDRPPEEESESPVLIISDVHVGQHTPARLTAGYSYSVAITERQFAHLAVEVTRIMQTYGRQAGWRRLTILDLGDNVENDSMHTTQHRLVDPLVVQQVQIYGRLLAGLVLNLLQVFPEIRVERVPGNHGRTSPKAGYAGLAELDPVDSYDWLAGEFAAAYLRDVERATILNHESIYAVTEVGGHRIVFEHGSSLRGGHSWGGIPYYGIDRAAAAYRELVGDFLVLALGHYHRPYMLPTGYGGWVIGNGSWAPTTPFVVATKHRVTRPSQTLFSVHPTRGVTAVWRIPLDQPWQEVSPDGRADAGDGARRPDGGGVADR